MQATEALSNLPSRARPTRAAPSPMECWAHPAAFGVDDPGLEEVLAGLEVLEFDAPHEYYDLAADAQVQYDDGSDAFFDVFHPSHEPPGPRPPPRRLLDELDDALGEQPFEPCADDDGGDEHADADNADRCTPGPCTVRRGKAADRSPALADVPAGDTGPTGTVVRRKPLTTQRSAQLNVGEHGATAAASAPQHGKRGRPPSLVDADLRRLLVEHNQKVRRQARGGAGDDVHGGAKAEPDAAPALGATTGGHAPPARGTPTTRRVAAALAAHTAERVAPSPVAAAAPAERVAAAGEETAPAARGVRPARDARMGPAARRTATRSGLADGARARAARPATAAAAAAKGRGESGDADDEAQLRAMLHSHNVRVLRQREIKRDQAHGVEVGKRRAAPSAPPPSAPPPPGASAQQVDEPSATPDRAERPLTQRRRLAAEPSSHASRKPAPLPSQPPAASRAPPAGAAAANSAQPRSARQAPAAPAAGKGGGSRSGAAGGSGKAAAKDELLDDDLINLLRQHNSKFAPKPVRRSAPARPRRERASVGAPAPASSRRHA